MWERACSRKRCVSHRVYRLNHRLRGQAPSHICFCVAWKTRLALLTAYASLKPCTNPLWERACSRKRCVSHRIYRLNHRLQGQAPLPHLFLRCLEDQARTLNCLRIAQTLHKPPVGAGLLAKALCQSPNLSTEPPPSGASPLPHLFLRCLEDQASTLAAYASLKPCTKPLWERSCPRKRCVSHRIYRLNTAFRGKPPPTFVFAWLGRSGQHTCLLTHCSNLAQSTVGAGLPAMTVGQSAY